MPALPDHLRAAEMNEQLASQLLAMPNGVAWSPVLTFYSALHLVDAYLAMTGIHPATHVARRAEIAQEAALRSITDDYRWLETLSRDARYELRQFSVPEAGALIDGELRRITAAIRVLLEPAGR